MTAAAGVGEPVEPVTFTSGSSTLIGLLHHAARPSGAGLIILVGGPQYRVGAHRQYLHLARRAAAAGIDVLRFDYSGIGDSEGTFPGFEHAGDDIAAATAYFRQRLGHLRRLYLWGLCESASSAMMFAPEISGLAGIIAANPWVESTETKSRTMLRHYYLTRLTDAALWRRLLGGHLAVGRSARGLLGHLRQAVRPGPSDDTGRTVPDFRLRMARGVAGFSGRILLLLSGNDLTAREFVDFTRRDRNWKKAFKTSGNRLSKKHFPGVDHTFSSAESRARVAEATIAWIRGAQADRAG